MTFLGLPLSSNIFLIRSTFPLSLCLVKIIWARCANVDIRPLLRLRGLKDSRCKYWPVKMGFRYTLVSKPISVLSTYGKCQETVDIFLFLFQR